jgi:AcrR family transcriptional regulator
MAPYTIPEDVRRFLLKWIDSVAHLEALLLLRDNAETAWSLPAVAARLYLDPEEVAPLLSRLRADGFIVMTDPPATSYRYHPSSDEFSAIVERVAEEYAKHLVPMTKLIHDKPRMRVQQFADAFKLRKDPS